MWSTFRQQKTSIGHGWGWNLHKWGQLWCFHGQFQQQGLWIKNFLHCGSDTEERKDWTVHNQDRLSFEFLENCFNNSGFVLFIIERRIDDKDVSCRWIDSHKLSEGELPHISHVFKRVIVNPWILNRVTKFNVVLFSLEYSNQFFTEIYLFRGWGIIFWYDMRIARYCVNDDGRIVLSRPSDFDCFSAIIDDNHFLKINLAFKVFSPLENIASHFLSLLHVCNLLFELIMGYQHIIITIGDVAAYDNLFYLDRIDCPWSLSGKVSRMCWSLWTL